jgi:hypothetical protein
VRWSAKIEEQLRQGSVKFRPQRPAPFNGGNWQQTSNLNPKLNAQSKPLLASVALGPHVGSSAQHGRYDRDRGHIWFGASLLVYSQAISLADGAIMIMNYIPLIFATVAMLAVFAFAAETNS